MRAVLQRVRHARVTVDAKVVGEIGPGLLVFLGVGHEDSQADGQWLAEKIAILRIVPDEHGHMNRSLREVAGDALVVSQFTLYARTRKGPRPSFKDAALPALAQPLYQTFLRHLSSALAGKPSLPENSARGWPWICSMMGP